MPRDEPGDEGTNGPPPHPLDRPWAHPTEMFARARAGAAPPTRPGRGRTRGRELGLALGAGVAGALVTLGVLIAVGAFRTSPEPPSAVASSAPTAPDDGARLAALAGPSVVGVLASTPTGMRRASGVCTGEDHVLTSAAAIAGASALTVIAGDGTTHRAEVLGRDDATGLVLLRAASDAVRPARLAGDRSVRVGEWVVAVGRGDTSAPWAATGVVASLGGWGQDGGGTKRAGLIATSMAIPRAAEGGALMDRDGHVVGILAGAPAGGTLAVPIDLARDVATELGRTGVAAHGRLGVRAVDSDTPRGAAITEVLAGSAAAGAGVQVGDVVVRVADVPVGDTAALVSEISRRKPDDKVDVHVRRAGKALTVRVRLDRAPVVPDGTAAAGTTSTTVSPAGTATPLAAGG